MKRSPDELPAPMSRKYRDDPLLYIRDGEAGQAVRNAGGWEKLSGGGRFSQQKRHFRQENAAD
jgi:hypothetical protein